MSKTESTEKTEKKEGNPLGKDRCRHLTISRYPPATEKKMRPYPFLPGNSTFGLGGKSSL